MDEKRLGELTKAERRELNRIVRQQRREWKRAKTRAVDRIPAYMSSLRERILGRL